MSWESDLIDDFIVTLQGDGRILALGVKARSICKGIEEGFPDVIATDSFPLIRISWTGTEEEDVPYDDRPERHRTVMLNVMVGYTNKTGASE